MKTKEDVLSIVRKNIRQVKRQLFDRDVFEDFEFAEDYGFDLLDMIELSEYCARDMMIDVSFYDIQISKTVGAFVMLLCERCRAVSKPVLV